MRIKTLSIKSLNHVGNIWRIFDVLPSFPFTTSKTKCSYYYLRWYVRVASQVAELKNYNLTKLGNVKKISKLHKINA